MFGVPCSEDGGAGEAVIFSGLPGALRGLVRLEEPVIGIGIRDFEYALLSRILEITV